MRDEPGPARERERVVVATPSAVGAASIGGYEVTSDSETVTSAGEGTLAFELACTGTTGTGREGHGAVTEPRQSFTERKL